jgi:glycosyltransferase involved in cell wall biosynthesis
MLAKYNIKSHKVISNGVNLPIRSDNLDYIDSLGLEKKKYVISIGRFLEEKGFDYLIRAFRKTEVSCIKLVIAGDTDYPTEYSERLKSLAKDNGVILTGFIKGEKLNQIYSFAKLFIMSSFEEGMPITLLEAMSYDLDVLASDIPANLKIGLDKDDYFKVGDENDLKEKIMKKLSIRKEHNFRTFLVEHYNWDKIALETYNTYKNLIN